MNERKKSVEERKKAITEERLRTRQKLKHYRKVSVSAKSACPLRASVATDRLHMY